MKENSSPCQMIGSIQYSLRCIVTARGSLKAISTFFMFHQFIGITKGLDCLIMRHIWIVFRPRFSWLLFYQASPLEIFMSVFWHIFCLARGLAPRLDSSTGGQEKWTISGLKFQAFLSLFATL